VPDVRARDVTQHAAMLFQIDKLRNAQTVRNVRAVLEPTGLHDVRGCRANGKWIRYKISARRQSMAGIFTTAS
jgi:hypothetical protein